MLIKQRMKWCVYGLLPMVQMWSEQNVRCAML